MFCRPYLSIVVVSRNDNHGDGLLQRMQWFIDSLSEQCNRYHIDAELIIVEWNPPVWRRCLFDVLVWPKGGQYLTIRIITVPERLHRRFQCADRISLFQMIGKNVGIRRARGEFILATNIDILFSNELMDFISKRQLRHGIVYRVNRVDVDPGISKNSSLDERLLFCRDHVIRTNTKYYILSFSNLKALVQEIVRSPSLIGYYLKNVWYKIGIPSMHYNTCGDFTLMAKGHWRALCGYPELEIFSLHIDSLLLMAAFYFGLKEEILHHPREIYHLEHSLGSGITPGAGQITLLKKLERDKIPFLTWRDVINIGQIYIERCVAGENLITGNDSSWGLGGIYLPEKIIGD